jgi:hypothetical protein
VVVGWWFTNCIGEGGVWIGVALGAVVGVRFAVALGAVVGVWFKASLYGTF